MTTLSLNAVLDSINTFFAPEANAPAAQAPQPATSVASPVLLLPAPAASESRP